MSSVIINDDYLSEYDVLKYSYENYLILEKVLKF